jgi:2-oxo-4-hydroxy-4-carboxy-5-ureidoimidazoline decarboxylase
VVSAQMNLEELNNSPAKEAFNELIRCCGSRRWAERLLARRPFGSREQLLSVSDQIWHGLEKDDFLEAFSHHPKIGDVDSLRKKFADTATWAEGEQKGVQGASEQTIRALADGNAAYEQKFGYIFIVCATGKTAEEMLGLLTARLDNQAERELGVAMAEQNKITHIRLEKLLS